MNILFYLFFAFSFALLPSYGFCFQDISTKTPQKYTSEKLNKDNKQFGLAAADCFDSLLIEIKNHDAKAWLDQINSLLLINESQENQDLLKLNEINDEDARNIKDTLRRVFNSTLKTKLGKNNSITPNIRNAFDQNGLKLNDGIEDWMDRCAKNIKLCMFNLSTINRLRPLKQKIRFNHSSNPDTFNDELNHLDAFLTEIKTVISNYSTIRHQSSNSNNRNKKHLAILNDQIQTTIKYIQEDIAQHNWYLSFDTIYRPKYETSTIDKWKRNFSFVDNLVTKSINKNRNKLVKLISEYQNASTDLNFEDTDTVNEIKQINQQLEGFNRLDQGNCLFSSNEEDTKSIKIIEDACKDSKYSKDDLMQITRWIMENAKEYVELATKLAVNKARPEKPEGEFLTVKLELQPSKDLVDLIIQETGEIFIVSEKYDNDIGKGAFKVIKTLPSVTWKDGKIEKAEQLAYSKPTDIKWKKDVTWWNEFQFYDTLNHKLANNEEARPNNIIEGRVLRLSNGYPIIVQKKYEANAKQYLIEKLDINLNEVNSLESPGYFRKAYNHIVNRFGSTRKLHSDKNPHELDPDTIRIIRKFLAGIAKGLEELHARKITHRDVKPGNILVKGDGNNIEAVLADFGLAFNPEINPNSGSTPKYAAPELFSKNYIGLSYIGPNQNETFQNILKFDVFSFGIVALEFLHRRFNNHHISKFSISAYCDQFKSYSDEFSKCIEDNKNEFFREITRAAKEICARDKIENNSCLEFQISRCLAPEPQNRPSFDEISSYFNKTQEATR